MNTKKGFAPLVLLIIVAVVAIGGGAYYYSENKKNDNPSASTSEPTTTSSKKESAEPTKVSPQTEEATITIKNDKVSAKVTYTPPQSNTNELPSRQNTTPMVNDWKIYTSTDYGLSFSYPLNLKTYFGVNKRTDNSDGTYSVGGGGGSINSGNSTQLLSVVVYERHPKDIEWRIDEFSSNAQPEKPLTIGNVNGKLQYESSVSKKYNLSEDGTSYTTTEVTQLKVRFISNEINKSGKRYRILAMVTLDQNNNWQSGEELLKSILSTISFLN